MTGSLRCFLYSAALGLFAVSTTRATGMGFGQARATGMAGAYTAVATGIHAPWWNPANLAAFPGPKLQVGIVNFGFLAGNDGVTYGDFVDWVEDEKLQTTEIQQALNQFPGNSISFHQSAEVGGPLSFVLGRYAFSVGLVQFANWGLPRGIVDAVSDSRSASEVYQEAKTTGTRRDLSGVAGEAWAVAVFGLSHARLIDINLFQRFAVGATVNFYAASPRLKVVESTGEVLVRANTWQANSRLVMETAGISVFRETVLENGEETKKIRTDGEVFAAWGLGLNLGVAGTWDHNISFSAALHNIPIRKITWKTAERRTLDINNGQKLINAKTVFDNKPEDADMLDYLDTLFAQPGAKVGSFEKLGSTSTTVPAYARVGVARPFFGNFLTWTFDVEQGFSETAITSTTPRVASGVEVRPLGRWLPLRAGMSIGGRAGHFAALGLGVNLWCFQLDVAVVNEGALTPFEVPFTKSARGVGAAAEMKLSF